MRALAPAIVAALLTLPGVAAGQVLQLPEPTAPTPRVVEEKSPPEPYYRLPKPSPMVALRFGLGTQVRVPEGGEQAAKAAFALDVLVGAAFRFSRGSRLGAWIEGGYSYVSFSEHLVSLGIGPMLYKIGPSSSDDGRGPGNITVALLPRGLLGSVEGGFALGERTSFIFAYHGFGLDLAHQYTLVGDRQIHEIHVAITSLGFFGERGG